MGGILDALRIARSEPKVLEGDQGGQGGQRGHFDGEGQGHCRDQAAGASERPRRCDQAIGSRGAAALRPEKRQADARVALSCPNKRETHVGDHS